MSKRHRTLNPSLLENFRKHNLCLMMQVRDQSRFFQGIRHYRGGAHCRIQRVTSEPTVNAKDSRTGVSLMALINISRLSSTVCAAVST